MEIGAHLDHVELLSPAPRACALFYGRTYAMSLAESGGASAARAPGRRLLFREGPANHIGYAAYAFDDRETLERHRERVASRAGIGACPSPVFGDGAFSATDPDGNRVVFGVTVAAEPFAADSSASAIPPARLQHLAVRSRDPAALLSFYRDALGFVVSDRVVDPKGILRACFLRTDREHHSLAIFGASEVRHDHLSFETRDWSAVRDWADRVSGLGVPMVWGIGRHGPGNDTFFMVRDPDGNLAEISAELETCAPERPEGVWPHAERTLNLWGGAIMRS